MYKIKSEVSFDAAHFLPDHQGKCKNLHGHRYIVSYCVSSQKLAADGSEAGMTADFTDLKRIMKEITGNFDHKLLIDTSSEKSRNFAGVCEDMGFETVSFNHPTTAEHLAETIYLLYEEALKKQYKGRVMLEYIEVGETPANRAGYGVYGDRNESL